MNTLKTENIVTTPTSFVLEIPKSNVLEGKLFTEGMLRGIKVATKLIRKSYGPKGLNISIERDVNPGHEIANDAQTIIQAIEVEGQAEKRGLNFLKELMNKVQKDSGDGRKTTCIMAEEIIEQGITSCLSGPEIKRELDALIPLIEKNINEQKRAITEDTIGQVASIAGESDALGETIQTIYKKIGKDGTIIPEPSGTYETSVSYIEGVRFQGTGFLSPYMAHEEGVEKPNKTVYEKPTILVTRRKITHIKEINPLLLDMQEKGKKDLVIFTDDMDSGVASTLIQAHKDGVMNILIIKASVLWKGYVFEDFAKVTGSTIIEDASGITFKGLKLEHLGTCDKITVDKEETLIIPSVDFSGHIKALQEEGSNDSKLRLSWLKTKTAILKLGANNESELSHKRLKCHDAINASALALKDGVVQGGGLALWKASNSLDSSVAANILKKALREPHNQILRNNGEDAGVFFKDFGSEIMDASAVVKNAMRNAISLASTVLTLGGDVAIPPRTPEQLAQQALAANRMRF